VQAAGPSPVTHFARGLKSAVNLVWPAYLLARAAGARRPGPDAQAFRLKWPEAGEMVRCLSENSMMQKVPRGVVVNSERAHMRIGDIDLKVWVDSS